MLLEHLNLVGGVQNIEIYSLCRCFNSSLALVNGCYLTAKEAEYPLQYALLT
jgi:hypothetical protein